MKKCSLKEHKEIDSLYYCQSCNIYMCRTCENYHSKLFDNHNSCNLNSNPDEKIIICTEKNHSELLKFFCKNHNQLCCASCICKIKNQEYGQHSNCDVTTIEEIKENKENKIKDNLSILKNLSNKLNSTIEKFKNISQKINENKEHQKIKVQKIFTKIRDAINQREEELFLEIDKKFEEIFFKDNIIHKSEKLEKNLRTIFERKEIRENGEELNNKYNIISSIKYYISIGNLIQEINTFKEIVRKYEYLNNFDIVYILEEEEDNKMYMKIKNFGKIYYNNFFFNSKIIDNIEYVKSIKNWFEPKKIIKAELLYKLSVNGEEVSTFHKLCDNQGATLILFHTKEGKKVGMFTSLSWVSDSLSKKDKEAFVFDLNKNKKYNIINDIEIYCDKNYGPHISCFGYFKIPNMKKIIIFSSINQVYENGYDILDNNGKESNYDLDEIEVFKICFENK